MNPSRSLTLSLILATALLGAVLLYRSGSEKILEEEKLAMGTLVGIKVRIDSSTSDIKARKAIDAAFAEIARVEKLFSIHKKDSEISRINSLKKGQRIKINDEAYEVIDRALGLCRITGGAFDITVGPLVKLWEKANERGSLPSDEEIEAALGPVGPQNISLRKSDKTIGFMKDGVELDLGGVAKGYASDRAMIILKNMGIKNAIVNSGGDMHCIGSRSRGVPWKIGIRDPRNKEGIILELSATNKAIDTSGDYEKYFTLGKKRYSHIIDPRTGYAVSDGAVSATVIADDSMTADALATALCVLGQDGITVVDSVKGTDAILVFTDSGELRIVMADRIKKRYDVRKK